MWHRSAAVRHERKGSPFANSSLALRLIRRRATCNSGLCTGRAKAMLESIELPDIPLLSSGDQGPGQRPLSVVIREILAEPDLDDTLEHEVGLEEHLVSEARLLARRAYPSNRTTEHQSSSWIDNVARDELHRSLLAVYQLHVRLPTDSSLVNQHHPLACRLLHEMELPWERDMLRRIHTRHRLSPAELPSDPAEFAAWFRTTAFSHPLYEHDLYGFIACEASRAQLEWFFQMECAGEAAFDDL